MEAGDFVLRNNILDFDLSYYLQTQRRAMSKKAAHTYSTLWMGYHKTKTLFHNRKQFCSQLRSIL